MILGALIEVAVLFLVFSVVHRISIAVFGALGFPRVAHLGFFFFAAIGAVGVYLRLVGNPLQSSSVLLYLSFCIVHAELTSLLSRGYSLRILYDLRTSGEGMTLQAAKEAYGGGVGVRGLLKKRLRTLHGLGLLSMENDTVGPLTALGSLAGRFGTGMRAALRLDNVG